MIPLKDQNPTRRFPIVTLILIGICAFVYLVPQQVHGIKVVDTGNTKVRVEASRALSLRYAAIPCELTQRQPLGVAEISQNRCTNEPLRRGPILFQAKNIYLAVLLSMFLHGSLLHLGGNVLYLWVFGNNIEDRFGSVFFLIFYLSGGVVATIGHVLTDRSSTIPVVGASGAIAAVMGAYLVWYPRASVISYVPPIFVFPLKAQWFLAIWFVMQFFTNPNSGVAWVAHVAGFVFGAALAALVGRPKTSGDGYNRSMT